MGEQATSQPDDGVDVVAHLRELLRSPPPAMAPLTITECIAELDGWMRHRRINPWQRQRNRRSLAAEVQETFHGLGPNLMDALAPTMERYIARFDSVAGQPRPSRDALNAAAALGSSLTTIAATPDALQATWRDVVHGLTNLAAAAAIDRWYRELMDLCRAAGHDAEHLRRMLAQVLADNPVDVLSARVALGDEEPPENWPDHEQDAGVAPYERLHLCERYLGVPVREGRCISWHAFAQARITRPVVQLGHVTLLEARWAVPNSQKDDGQMFPGREELRRGARFGPLRDLDEVHSGRNIVLARVDMGNRTTAGALSTGRAIVNVITEVAAIEATGASWEEFGWEMLVVDGRPIRTSTFLAPAEEAREVALYTLDRTAEAIEDRGASLAAALASSSLPPDLAEAVRSASEATRADVRSRVILHDRIVEMVASYASAASGASMAAVLVSAWASAKLRAELRSVIHMAISPDGFDDERRYLQAQELAPLVRHHGRAMRFTIDFEAAVEHASPLLKLWSGTLMERRLRWAIDALMKGDAYLSALTTLESQERLLRGRLRRVRNALAHGNPVHEAAVNSVDDFGRFLGSASLQTGLRSFTDGYDVMNRLQTQADERRAFREGLLAGTSPLDLMTRQR